MTNREKDEAAQTSANPDKEIWRRNPDDYYSPSIHVTESGGIGMNVGGYVIVAPIEKWYQQAKEVDELRAQVLSHEKGILAMGSLCDDYRAKLKAAREALCEYGWHKFPCKYSPLSSVRPMPGELCTCGLDAALSDEAKDDS